MSNITRADRLAAKLRAEASAENGAVKYSTAMLCSDELRRLAESERALLEALELAASIIGHPDDDTSRQIGALIAATKEASK
jgi:hypothetical protein